MSKQILIVDSQVQNYQQLLAGIHPNFEVAILDPNQDGILQITHILQTYNSTPDLNALSVHLVAHGVPGGLHLGNSQLQLSTLDHYSEHIRSWFSSQDSELLLYGCNVAAGDAGEEFINKLHQLTTVNIAASSTPIGNSALGGNWDLDIQAGKTRSQIAFQPKATNQYPYILEAVRVAVAGSTTGDASGLQAIVNQLNNDTYFDFTAVLVAPEGLDSAAELNNYDVVVIGNDGNTQAGDSFSVFGSALASWVQAGGGLVSAGWTVFGSLSNNANEVALDAVIPVTTTGSGVDYGFLSPGDILTITDAAHPVTQGVSNFVIGSEEFAEYPLTVNAEGTVLATATTPNASALPSVVIGQYGSGRSVYLSPSYSASSSTSLRTGEADQLLEQAVAWASSQIVVESPDETFETGDFSRLPWEFNNNPWIISSDANTGLYSAQSAGNLGALGNSSMSLTLEIVEADEISFDWKVSSESGGDFLKFFIDGVEQASISGNQPYQTFTTPVLAGEHTFTWSYEKNGSVNQGTDGGFVDNIFLPPTDLNNAPVFTSPTSTSIEENTTLAIDVNATDVDNNPIIYSISNSTELNNIDAARFSINSTTGELSFNNPPDFEAPSDANTDNTYLVEVVANDGVGGISTQSLSITVSDAEESSANSVTDFNNDNLPDIVWRNASQGLTSVWYTNGSTRFGNSAINPAVSDASWVTVGIGDYDKDGHKDDILWRNSAKGTNSVWFMDGNTRVGTTSVNTVADTNWVIRGVGDFDHSGYADDILWHNQSTGQTIVWTMDGVSRTGDINFGTVATAWRPQGVGDFEGNGNLDDIVWRNFQTGQTNVWRTNGLTRTGGFNFSEIVPTNWEIEGVSDLDGDGGVDDLLWYNESNYNAVSWFVDNGVKTSSIKIGTAAAGWDAVI